MASSSPQASVAWHGTLKIRKHLLKDLEKLQAGSASGIDVSQFEAVDSLLEKFRLGCVSTIFLDFDYAVAEHTEDALWLSHTSINSEYRRILGRLKQSSHTVEKRKVEKMYNNFLRIAQKFYMGYIQRLSARYDIQELKRIAQGISVEQLAVEDKISPVSADLQAKVLISCHSTLIRLGDLTRYRAQARHRNSGYEPALVYYSLAHHLKPHSGFAFHQMGIVNLEQGKHLDIVYHFYRAWAVETPHPNAKSNLEAEFKTLRVPPSTRSRHKPTAPQEILPMWFVRLHAYFYKGEVFQTQGELEGEVMHWLEMAGRSATSTDSLLLKMALVNMSAHHIATLKYTENQTEPSSRFYQYTLRFNALFIHKFCEVIESELQDAMSNTEDVADQSDETKKASVIESLLPILRIYCIWLAGHIREVFGTADAFGTVIPQMVQILARIFTLLCVETYSQENLTTCPYLLGEDVEMLGLQPLSDAQVPEACRFYYGEDGKTKPYLQTPERRLEPSVEKAGRILDILRCAYFLAENPTVPLAYKIEKNSLVFEHRPVMSSSQPLNAESGTSQATDTSQNRMNGVDGGPNHTSPAQATPATAASQTPTPSGVDTDKLSRDISSNGNYELSRDVDDAENTVINMLAPFLKPPTPQPHESSYGMHTATANDIFAAFEIDPSPAKSIPSGKFEPLPWDWFNTPNPHKEHNSTPSAGQEAFNGHRNVARSPNTSVAVGKPLEDPFATPGRHASGAFARNVASDIGSPSSNTAQRAHRERLLQTFSNASAPRTSSFGQWSQSQNTSRQTAPVSSAWGPQSPNNAPFSSGISGFSHPSSLYQGTPANGSLHIGQYSTDLGRSLSQDATHRENGQSLGRHFQMDDTTSNYDEAILKAAYHGAR